MEKQKGSPSRSTVNRHKRARAVARRGCDCVEKGLPMPYAPLPEGERRHKVEVMERFHYEEHRRHHLERFSDYDTAWERPTPDTARKVYDLVRNYVPALDGIHPDPVTAMQLITVALDVGVVSARYGYRQEERYASPAEQLQHVRRAVTRNMLSDAIMRRWSDHARQARQDKRAYALTQMTEATAENAWRDLLLNDIYLPVLWGLIADHITGQRHPLFRAWPSHRRDVEGYDIKLHRGPELKAFERFVRYDPDYKHSRVRHAWRLWVVGKRRPAVDIHAPICAERKYNDVTIGDETQAVLKIQEDARLLFNAGVFVMDYREAVADLQVLRAEIKKKFPKKTPRRGRTDEERTLRDQVFKLHAFVLEFRSIYEQVRPIAKKMEPRHSSFGRGLLELAFAPQGLVPIRSAFYKVVNRRFQNAHFFPMRSSGKTDRPPKGLVDMLDTIRLEKVKRPDVDLESPMRLLGEELAAPRSRWFQAPGPRRTPERRRWERTESLVSMDISASQTQIQAILLGIEDMEQDSVLSRRPHKESLAERAWAAHKADIAAGRGPLLIGYDGPKDKRLIEMVKNLWMLLGYGPQLIQILTDQEKDPGLYGRGWRKRQDGKRDVRAIDAFLHDVPGYGARWTFLESCKQAGLDLIKANAYAGATLVDPLDDATFEWNRPLQAAVPLRLHNWDLTLIKPGTYRTPMKPGRYENERCPKVKAGGKRCGAFGTRRGERWKCRNRECGHVWPATFQPSAADPNGNLRVDEEKLRKMIAPCIIHMLDSLFSAFVMQELVADGVPNFVGIHDCWYVPETVYRDERVPERGHDVLGRAILAAGKPWLLALEPVYGWLRANVGGPQIEDAYRKWKDRVQARNWPYFYAVPSGWERPRPSA